LGICLIGPLWVAYALLGFVDSVHNYIAWKKFMTVMKIYQGGIYQGDIGVAVLGQVFNFYWSVFWGLPKLRK